MIGQHPVTRFRAYMQNDNLCLSYTRITTKDRPLSKGHQLHANLVSMQILCLVWFICNSNVYRLPAFHTTDYQNFHILLNTKMSHENK